MEVEHKQMPFIHLRNYQRTKCINKKRIKENVKEYIFILENWLCNRKKVIV